MTFKADIPEWELVETLTGISRDGMFAMAVEVWSAKRIKRFAVFTSERPVLGFKCPTTTQMRVSDRPPRPNYDAIQPPSGDRREAHALACCRREAWKTIRRKLGTHYG